MARPREYDEKQVLTLAMNAFWKHGYEATSITDLMDATGLAKGSIYKGFGDKRTFFLQALNHYLQQGREGFREVVAEADGSRDAVRAWLSHVAKLATCRGVRRGCMAVNCAIELAPHDKEIQERLRKHFGQMEVAYAALIEKGQLQGVFRDDLNPMEVARWLTTIINGLQVRGKLGLTPTAADESVDLTMATLDARSCPESTIL